MNSPKLAALQKVLQSDFCNAIREVYEHVYETVDISGSPEIRANATAKVCYATLELKPKKLCFLYPNPNRFLLRGIPTLNFI